MSTLLEKMKEMKNNVEVNPGTEIVPVLMTPQVAVNRPEIATDPLWFLNEGFDATTCQADLGISYIKVFKAKSEAQRNKGIYAKVSLRTANFSVNGITVFINALTQPIQRGDQLVNYTVKVVDPSFLIQNKWYSDIKLTRAARAKIATVVFSTIDQATGTMARSNNIWYLDETLQDQPDLQINAKIDSIGFRKLNNPSAAQIQHSIFGKAYFNTPVASVSNCTVFYKELDSPINGRNYAFNVANPSRKNKDGEQMSDIFLTKGLRAEICRYIDSLVV